MTLRLITDDTIEEKIDALARKLENKLKATNSTLQVLRDLTSEEESLIDDFVFLCRILPNQKPILDALQKLTAQYAATFK